MGRSPLHRSPRPHSRQRTYRRSRDDDSGHGSASRRYGRRSRSRSRTRSRTRSRSPSRKHSRSSKYNRRYRSPSYKKARTDRKPARNSRDGDRSRYKKRRDLTPRRYSSSSSSSRSSSPTPHRSNDSRSSNNVPAPVALPPPGSTNCTLNSLGPAFSSAMYAVPPPPPGFSNPYAMIQPPIPSGSLLPPPPPPPISSAQPYVFDMTQPPPPPPPPPPPVAEKSSYNRGPKSNFSSPIKISLPSRPVVLKPTRHAVLPPRWGMGGLDSYEIMTQVGEGTYGQVYKARKRDSGDMVALKKVRLENEREGFPITAVREIKLLTTLDHPNIVKLLDVVTEGKNTNITAFFLVFEYVDHDLNGLLESQMVMFKEMQVASLFKQLLLALQHCHGKELLHRDLKCANILVNNKGELKLGDFGLARIYDSKRNRMYTNRVITLWYRPPELLLGEERYGPAVDIWSAGCILGELFMRKPIFPGQSEQTQLDLISQTCGTPSIEMWPSVAQLPNFKTMRFRNYHSRSLRTRFSCISDQPLDLLDRLLSLDPSKRPTASKALEHKWLSGLNPAAVTLADLPKHQDCHEMWSKKQKAERNADKSRRSSSMSNSQPLPPHPQAQALV